MLAGQGSHLLLYDVSAPALIDDVDVLFSQSINALIASGNQVNQTTRLLLVSAGSHVRTIVLRSNDDFR